MLKYIISKIPISVLARLSTDLEQLWVWRSRFRCYQPSTLVDSRSPALQQVPFFWFGWLKPTINNNHCQIKVKVSVPGKSPFRKDNVSPLYFVHSFFYGNAIVCMVEVVVVLLIMYIIIYHEFDTKNTFVAVKPLSKKTGLIIYFFTRIVVSNTKLFQAIFIWNVFIVVYLQCRRKVRWDVPDKHCRLKRRLDALRPSWDFQIHLQGSFQTKKCRFFKASSFWRWTSPGFRLTTRIVISSLAPGLIQAGRWRQSFQNFSDTFLVWWKSEKFLFIGPEFDHWLCL